MFSDKVVYALNTSAVGDLIAAAPVVKFAIDNFHKQKNNYKVAVHAVFRDFYSFVPEDRFIDLCPKYEDGYAVRYLNQLKSPKYVCRLTPSRVKLTHYASINLLGRVLDDVDMPYPPLAEVDVSRYNVDFKNSVVLITSYKDRQRMILPDELLKIAEYIYSKGITPVYVGKTGTAVETWKNSLAYSDFKYPGFGVDLRNNTSFKELASIMSQAKAVVGVDGGPIHIAWTTKTPVVCGFTTIRPDLRIPYRGVVPTIPVVPNITCNFCESDWLLNLWNFNNCPRKLKLAECVTKIDGRKFIDALIKLRI